MKKTTREWVKKAEKDYVLAVHGSRSKIPVHDGVPTIPNYGLFAVG